MMQDVRIIIANPAGNITIFVLDKFDRGQYQTVATQLLQQPDLGGEQVAFIKNMSEMEMCGLEFCGNASRSFALIGANFRKIKGAAQIEVKVSGSDELLTVDVDTTTDYTKIKMPMAQRILRLEKTGIAEIEGRPYVDFGGIGHVILEGVPASDELFNQIKGYINATYNPPAMGVMFFDKDQQNMTPIVYVAGVDTTYWEGSCGSGSTAAALAFSDEKPDGVYKYELKQPAGTIISSVVKSDGQLKSVYIEGPVELSPIKVVKIDC